MEFPRLRDGSGKDELQKLQNSHEKIIRLAAMGMVHGDIAKEVGCHKDKVRYTLKGQLGSQKLEVLKTAADVGTIDIAKNIHETAEKAIKLMDEVVSGDHKEASIKERIGVAIEVLKMDGHTPVSKQVIDVRLNSIEKLGMERIRDRAQKLRLLPPPEVVEADFKPVSLESGDMPEGL